jgi:hypothetical protein
MKVNFRSLGKKLLKLLPWLAIAATGFIQLAVLSSSSGLGDFGSFYASGQAASMGQDPYGVYTLTARAVYGDLETAFPNLNPPISLVFFELLSKTHPETARTVWTGLSVGFYLLGLLLLYLRFRPALIWIFWALVLPGFWDTLVLGQIYTLVFLLGVCAWISLANQRQTWTGIFHGILASIKPNLLFVPFLMLINHQKRAALAAFSLFLLISLLPVLRYGPGIYQQWYEAVSQASWVRLPHYLSLPALGMRIGASWLGYALAGLLLLGLCAWVWRKEPAALLAGALALVGAILASPLATPRFILLLVPVFFTFSRTLRLSGPAAILLLPTSLLIWSGFNHPDLLVWTSLVYPAALLWLLFLLVGASPANTKGGGMGQATKKPHQ